MTFKIFDYKNTQVRIMRASFTGELGYEIYISPSCLEPMGNNI